MTLQDVIDRESVERKHFVLLENMTLLWAEERNLISGSVPKDQLAKLVQELGEVSDAICKSDVNNLQKELGDMLVVMMIISKMYNLDLTGCLEASYNKIKNRRGVMYDGVFVKEEDEEYPEILMKLAEERLRES